MNVGLLFRLTATTATEDDVSRFLESDLGAAFRDLPLHEWHAVRFGILEFGVLAVFDDVAGEESHVGDRVAGILNDKVTGLLTGPPAVESFDVLTSRVAAPAGGSSERG
jgi:hypothetical protein